MIILTQFLKYTKGLYYKSSVLYPNLFNESFISNVSETWYFKVRLYPKFLCPVYIYVGILKDESLWLRSNILER